MRIFRPWRGRTRASVAVVAGAVVTAAALAIAMAAGVAASPARGALAARQAFRLPHITHVWVIELENQGYSQSFGHPSADPYLARTLPEQGALLRDYYAIGHNSADNYIAQISGQSPNLLTQEDCPIWVPLPDITVGPYHQVLAPQGGCVFPASIPTLGSQLSDAKLSWTAYLQDMGNNPARDRTAATPRGPACGHPATWGIDHTQSATTTDQYAARHQGFMYFRSVTANAAYCAAHVLSFRPLSSDLAAASTTPAFSWISPNLCNDGHDVPCVTGEPGGLRQIDTFLAHWVPLIMASPAYKDGGLILITFDEGSTKAACCGENSGFSSSHPSTLSPGLGGPGGGDVGLVALSPFIKPGTVSAVAYNHYSLLRTIEDIFALPHLGDAAMAQVKSFGPDVFTRP
jgi:phosphatidylinositol-3-phosphatase